MARVVGLPRLQALYRRFVGLDLDKGRAAEVLEVAEKKLADLFEAAAERAEAEGRETIRWLDLPLTKGLKETMERYEREREKLNDPRLDPGPIAEYVAKPAHHLALDEEVMEKLPSLAATVLLLIGYVIKTHRPGDEEAEQTRHREGPQDTGPHPLAAAKPIYAFSRANPCLTRVKCPPFLSGQLLGGVVSRLHRYV